MRKTLILAVSVLALGFSTPVFASSHNGEHAGHEKAIVKTETQAHLSQGCKMKDQMVERQKTMLDQMVRNGQITTEQAKLMQDNMAAMKKDMMSQCKMMSGAHGGMTEKNSQKAEEHQHNTLPEKNQNGNTPHQHAPNA